MTARVILNEQHQLMDAQKAELDERFNPDGWEIFPVPENGWKLDEMQKIAEGLSRVQVVFASPVPALMKLLSAYSVDCQAQRTDGGTTETFFVLHNDRREKKELPNGKIIMTVAKTGWVIV